MKPIALNNLDKSKWQKFSLQEIAQSISERVDPKTTELDVYVGLEHLDAESLHIKRFGKRDDVSGTKLRCYPGDVIFGKRRAYQRKAAIVEFDGFCSAHALVLRANSEVIDPKLFPFFLHSDQFMHRAIDISVGGLSPTINWTKLKTQEFLLPPRDQQAKLAELLWAADELVKQKVGLLQKLSQNCITLIERNFLNRTGKINSLSKVGSIIRGVGYKPIQLLDEMHENSVILLRSNNIKNNYVNFDNIQIVPRHLVSDEQLIRKGDFAVCMSNGSKELVGKTAKFLGCKYPVCVGSFCSIYRPSDDISGKRAAIIFRSKSYRNRIKQILTGSNINNLKPSDFEMIRFRSNDSADKNKCVDQIMTHMNTEVPVQDSYINDKQLLKSLINQIF